MDKDVPIVNGTVDLARQWNHSRIGIIDVLEEEQFDNRGGGALDSEVDTTFFDGRTELAAVALSNDKLLQSDLLCQYYPALILLSLEQGA